VTAVPAPGELHRPGGPNAPEHRHGSGGPGHLDESARRLSHEEIAVAQVLVAEGHEVRSLAVGAGPTADLSVCRRATEVKTLRSGATAATVANALRRARHQGTDVIVDARGSGLLVTAAQRGVDAFAARLDRGRVERIRVVGDGFDRSYGPRQLDGPSRPLSRGIG
jgi:hypothetical protein